MPPLTKFITVLLLILLTACAATRDPASWSATEFYDLAQDAMKIEDYQTAIKYFEDLEIHHPFSPYAQQAQLEVIYAYYKYDEPDSAIAAAERYIKLYPRAENVDYAYYLRGLISFDRGVSTLDLVLDLETDKRQSDSAKQAFIFFEELIKRYPDSIYGNDAKQRMLHLRNHLAKYEIYAASYYLQRGAYLSAANRAKFVLQTYPQTPAIPDALLIMIKAYRLLGIDDLAEDAISIFKLNYPQHPSIEELG